MKINVNKILTIFKTKKFWYTYQWPQERLPMCDSNVTTAWHLHVLLTKKYIVNTISTALALLIHSLTLIMLIHYLALRGLRSEAVWTGLGLRYVFVLRTFFQYEVLHALTNKYCCCCNHYLYSSQHSVLLYLYASTFQYINDHS